MEHVIRHRSVATKEAPRTEIALRALECAVISRKFCKSIVSRHFLKSGKFDKPVREGLYFMALSVQKSDKRCDRLVTIF